MNKTITRLLGMLTALAFAAPIAHADDIDIFSGVGGSGGAPQVLLVVDNGSSNDAAFSYTCGANSALNGTTILGMVNCALYSAVGAITTQPAVLGTEPRHPGVVGGRCGRRCGPRVGGLGGEGLGRHGSDPRRSHGPGAGGPRRS